MPTLATLRERHDAIVDGPGAREARASYRNQTRTLAKRLGTEVPAWAAPRGRSHHRPRKPGSACTIATAFRDPSRTPATPADVAALDALRAWRLAGEGRIVQVSGAAVTLHEIGGARRFGSVADALAAVA